VKRQLVNALTAIGPAAEGVLRGCLQHSSPQLRAAAAFPLVTVGGEQTAGALLPLLADADPEVRQAAAAALASLGRTTSRAAVEMLQSDDLQTALAAADALASAGSEVFDELLGTAKSERTAPRAGACRALGSTGDERAGPHLVARLKDSEAVVRAEAAVALGRLAWVRATPHLLGALDDADPAVSRAAIGALRQLGQPAVEALLARLVEPDGRVRESVVQALAGIGEAALRGLLRAAQEGGLPARVAALRALGTIGGEKVVVPLVHALSDPEAEVRAQAVQSTIMLGRGVVPKLIVRLRHQPGNEARDAIVDALVGLGEGSVAEAVDMLQGPVPELRETAAVILGRVGMPAARALRAVLGHPDPDIRMLAVRAVAEIGDASVVPQLMEMVEDTDTGVSSESIRALAQLEDPRGASAVVRALGAGSAAVREALDFAIPRFGGSVAAALADRLLEDDPAVVQQAAEALRLLPTGAEEALAARLGSDLPAMRIAAARVMGTLDGFAGIEPLTRALADPDPQVRDEVARALGAIGAPAVGPVLDGLAAADAMVEDAILATLRAMTVDPVYSLMERARDADGAVRLAAVRMAGRLGRPEAVPTLEQRLHDTSLEINQIADNPAIRALAEGSITRNAELAARVRQSLFSHAPVALPILVQLAARRDGPPDPAYLHVATELARVAPGVVERMMGDPAEHVRRTAAVVLGNLGDDEALRTLVQNACAPDFVVRRAAMEALIDLGPEALSPLSGLLTAPDAEVQAATADALTSLGPQGVEVLIQHLRSSQDQGLSAVICAALGRTGAESALVALRELLGASPRDAVWLSAAAALAQAGQVEGTEALA